MSTRFSLYNSGQLSQFVLSFHLVTVLTALLIPLPGKTLQYILPSILILEHCLSISSPPNLQPRQSIHHFHAIRETEPVISEQRITATLFAEKPVLPLPRVLDEMIVTKEIPAVYDKLIFLNRFLGTWKLIRSRSDPMEEVSKAMNVSWAIRKVFEKFTPSCRYKRDGAILTIEQLLPMNITKNIVLHIDGNEHYENDSNIGAWSTITNSIIHEQTVVSQRRRKNDGLIAIETRKILTEGEIEKGIPDLLKDVLWYKVEVKRCLDGPIIASANRFLSREEAPPIGIPMPWDASMKTQGTVERLIEEEETAETPIPLLASLDELPLALPSLMIVENDSRRAIRKKRISNISDKHQDDKQQSDKHQRSKRLMYSKLSFRNKEFRSVHWNEQQCLHKCIRDLVRLKELNVHINQIQYVVDLSQTVAEQIHYLCSMDDPTQIELKLRKTDSSTKGKFWTMIRSEHNLIIDKMMLEIGRPTIGRSSTFVRTNLSVSELIDFLYDPTWPLKGIDDTVVTAFPMYQINPDTMIAYQALSGAFGATGRDIVYATTRVLSSDGSWGVVSAVTVDLPVIETEEFKRRFSKRFVRATVVRAGMEVRIENNGLRLTYISQTDGKEVMLPNWVLDRIRVGHLRRIVSLREFIQTHLQR